MKAIDWVKGLFSRYSLVVINRDGVRFNTMVKGGVGDVVISLIGTTAIIENSMRVTHGEYRRFKLKMAMRETE